MLWTTAFFLLVESNRLPAGNMVAIPVVIASLLFGARGALLGTLVGVLGISTFHVVAGTDSFSVLLRNSGPFSVAILLVLSLIVSYIRQLEAKNADVTLRITSTENELEEVSSEATLISKLSIELAKAQSVESVFAASGDALGSVIEFDRMAAYSVESESDRARLSYLSSWDGIGPSTGAEFSYSEITAIDPYDVAYVLDGAADMLTAGELQPMLILHRTIFSDYDQQQIACHK